MANDLPTNLVYFNAQRKGEEIILTPKANTLHDDEAAHYHHSNVNYAEDAMPTIRQDIARVYMSDRQSKIVLDLSALTSITYGAIAAIREMCGVYNMSVIDDFQGDAKKTWALAKPDNDKLSYRTR